MKARPLIEWLLYAVIIVLSLIGIALVLNAPPEFVKNKVVYGGF